MSRAGKALLAVAFAVSVLATVGGYCVVMFTENGHVETAAFFAMLAGIGGFLISMHAWTDLS
jgi:hypothetical protein